MPAQIEIEIGEQAGALARVIAANSAALEKARSLLQAHALVRLLAIGSSRHAAAYGAEAFEGLAATPATLLPAPGAGVALPGWTPQDLVIVVSQSGETPALLDAAKSARDAGADVIAVINQTGSEIEALATVTLHCQAGEERVVAATKSVTTQALLLRELAQPIIESQLAKFIAAVEEALVVDLTAVNRGPAPAAIVCGGFGAQAIADEIALKFAEVCEANVAAEPLVEYLHGPIAARGLVLAFVDPADPNAPALSANPGVLTLATPVCGDESLDALVRLVVGQRAAVACAKALDRDPDGSHGLSKVTRTL
jgi:glutamine---fructose-6-phosphate transaminase (isomerizing)